MKITKTGWYELTFACDHCEKEFFCIRNVQVTYSTKFIPDKKEASHG